MRRRRTTKSDYTGGGQTHTTAMKNVIIAIIVVLLMPVDGVARTRSYSLLWEEVAAARDADQPLKEISVLGEIVSKAEAAGDYGQLLKAEASIYAATVRVSPDSVKAIVKRIEAKERDAEDDVIRAIYDVVLYEAYKGNRHLVDGADTIAEAYRLRSVAHPDALAEAKDDDYEPTVVKGRNAKVFGSDMLSVIGFRTGNYTVMREHYEIAGHRAAACICALYELRAAKRADDSRRVNKNAYIRSLDSLTNVYYDLDVAGEIAVERYEYMESSTDATDEELLAYINHALDRYGGWQRAGVLRDAAARLTAPRFNVTMANDAAVPMRSGTARLTGLRGIRSLTMRVYRVDAWGDTTLSPDDEDGYKAMKSLLTEQRDKVQTRSFIKHPPCRSFEDSIAIPPLPAGVYMLEFATSPSTTVARRLYYVSDIYTIVEALPGNKVRYAVLNATTGHGIPGARITVSSNRTGKQPITLVCDDQGEAMYTFTDNTQYNKIFAYTDTDKYSKAWNAYGKFSYYGNGKTSTYTTLFTDRSVYRPGQTIYAAAVVYTNNGGTENKAAEGDSVTVTLRDAAGRVVETKSAVTDAYGVCHADFTLPSSGVLDGSWRLTAGNGSAVVRVEEYKRPTFAVSFPEINERYEWGDTLMVTGRVMAYAGTPVQGASVHYTITRSEAVWWRLSVVATRRGGARETIATGSAVTDSSGRFTIEIPLTMALGDGVEKPSSRAASAFYTFTAEATVTSGAGETHTASLRVPLGTHPTMLTSDLPERVEADSLRAVTFRLRNASGMDIVTDVRFTLDDSDDWRTARTTIPAAIDPLPSGSHTLTAVCDGDTLCTTVTVFRLDDTRLPHGTHSWFYTSRDAFPADGGGVTVQAGTADSNVHILYSIIAGTRVIESGCADVSDTVISRTFTYKDEYGDGLLLTAAWVKDNVCYKYKTTIKRPTEDKNLRITWETFRDRLEPGQKETWTMRVSLPDGSPAEANVIATLYDMALDDISPHTWRLNPRSRINMPSTSWASARVRAVRLSGRATWRRNAWQTFEPSGLDDVLTLWYTGGESAVPFINRRMRGAATRSNTPALTAADGYTACGETDARSEPQVEALASQGEYTQDNGSGDEGGAPRDSDGGTVTTVAKTRVNLTETAFFTANARADGDGRVSIAFTLPESVTTWRFLCAANTADMRCGTLSAQATASKRAFVQPYMPRFLRAGDDARITATITSLADTLTRGRATMTLTDPESGRTVYETSQPFTAKKDAAAIVSFNYCPSGEFPLLICTIAAAGNGFRDGEQHYLPVLPDIERVTTAKPFLLTGSGTTDIDVSDMVADGSAAATMTVECTARPEWLAVQALPTICYPRGNNAIDIAAAYYAISIADYVIVRSPEAEKVFEQWRSDVSDGGALQSALATDSELKDIVLAETPWVAEAESERERKAALCRFFDRTSLSVQTTQLAERLRALQNADGSWSWFPGMDGSVHITAEIVMTLARLETMTGGTQPLRTLADKAWTYLDRCAVRAAATDDGSGMERQRVSGAMLKYLYSNAIVGRTPTGEAADACRQLVDRITARAASQTIYEKALTAVILYKSGRTDESRDYARSLKEYTVWREDIGRYYDTRKAEYTWQDYKIPSHVAAMEALRLVAPDDTRTLDEMTLWLLREKETQTWDTPINSVNAVYALLGDSSACPADQQGITLAVDGTTMTAALSAGIGYVKTTMPAGQHRTVSVTKRSEGVSWGAVYAQYCAKSAAVPSTASGMRITKELIGVTDSLRVGDKVTVRITIEADRDYDFVQITDRRGACMEPARQLSGYADGVYTVSRDNATNYFIGSLAKGIRRIETDYYIVRSGTYETGTCTACCAYAPEYRATAPSVTLTVNDRQR